MRTTIFPTNNFSRFHVWQKSPKHFFLIVLFTVFASMVTFAQQQNLHYRFRLQGITDPAGAKMVTDILRPVFNTTEDPDAVFPNFNDELDQFDFFSPVTVSEDQLEAVLAPHGLLLIAFSNANETTTPKPEER